MDKYEMLQRIHHKLIADGINEFCDDAVVADLDQCIKPEILKKVWFADRTPYLRACSFAVSYVHVWAQPPHPDDVGGYKLDHLYYFDLKKGWYYLNRAGYDVRRRNISYCEHVLEPVFKKGVSDWADDAVKTLMEESANEKADG